MKSWIIKLLEWLTKNKGVSKPDAPVVQDAPKPVDVAGLPCAALPVTATVSNVKHVKGKTTWAMSGTATWPKRKGKKIVQGMTFLYVWRDGEWRGGKFDWFAPKQTTKDHKNIEIGYMDIIPKSGERVAFGLVNRNAKQRSNFVEGVWP